MGKGIKRLREGGMVEWIYPVQPEDPPENYVPEDRGVHQGHQQCTALLARANCTGANFPKYQHTDSST